MRETIVRCGRRRACSICFGVSTERITKPASTSLRSMASCASVAPAQSANARTAKESARMDEISRIGNGTELSSVALTKQEAALVLQYPPVAASLMLMRKFLDTDEEAIRCGL